MTTTDRPSLGILLMLGFCLMIPFADAISKVLGATLPVIMIVLARFVSQTILLTPMVLGKPRTIRRDQLGAITLRAILQIVGISLMFFSLLYLPLADAIAIAFVMPFILLLLGWWVLGEEVGRLRLMACAVGFAGTLMVVQPSFVDVGWPAVMPIGVAIVYALFVLQTRRLAQDISAIELQAASGAIATLVLVPIVLFGTAFGIWQLGLAAPTPWEWTLLVTTGVVGTVAHLLMTLSLRFAPAATLAPMQYLEIPFAAAVGYAIFGDFPNGMALAGICVTIAAGLFIIWREQRRAQAPA